MPSFFPLAVYILCAVTSVVCAVLLVRGYRMTRTRLLLWSSICFVGLALNNILLLIDLAIFPEVTIWIFGIDLAVMRATVAAAGVGALVYGLIWDGA
jgi:hypothetical protein